MMLRAYRRQAIGLAVVGTLALGMVLTACGGSEKSSGSAATPDQQPAAAASAAPSSVSGGASTGAGSSQSQPQTQTQTQAQPQATTAARSDAALGGLLASKSCLIGEWEAQDLQGYMSSLFSQSSGRITDVTGSMHISAKPNGTITETVSQVTVNVVTGASTMAISMDGGITASYAESDGNLTFSNIGGTLTTSAAMDGKQLLPPTNAIDKSLFGQENSHIEYQCKGDTLSFPLTLSDRQIDGLTFHRAR